MYSSTLGAEDRLSEPVIVLGLRTEAEDVFVVSRVKRFDAANG